MSKFINCLLKKRHSYTPISSASRHPPPAAASAAGNTYLGPLGEDAPHAVRGSIRSKDNGWHFGVLPQAETLACVLARRCRDATAPCRRRRGAITPPARGRAQFFFQRTRAWHLRRHSWQKMTIQLFGRFFSARGCHQEVGHVVTLFLVYISGQVLFVDTCFFQANLYNIWAQMVHFFKVSLSWISAVLLYLMFSLDLRWISTYIAQLTNLKGTK